MDDIEAIHRHLDRVPDDHTARLVLADRLEEAGSPLAEGMRALGANGLRPKLPDDRSDDECSDCRWFLGSDYVDSAASPWSNLPDDWFLLVEGKQYPPKGSPRYWVVEHPSRREAEDAAAEAFARLPESRRRELLAKLYGG